MKKNTDQPSYELMGVEINPLTLTALLDVINRTVQNNERLVIASQNLHSVFSYHKDDAMKKIQDIAIKRVDGMPLVMIGKLYGYDLNREHRLTWVDLFWPLVEFCNLKGMKVFFLAGEPAISDSANKLITNKMPNLKTQFRNGYFDMNGDENKKIISQIEDFDPDILIVGMGMPRQERWIVENQSSLNTRVIMTSGAILEYITGHVKTPPRFMGQIGLEWLYRLVENPKRFWGRYLIEPWYILYLLLKDFWNFVVKR